MVPQKDDRISDTTSLIECFVETDPFKSELQVSQVNKESVPANSSVSALDRS